MIQAEQGEASMSMADVDQSAVGKKNATRVTAADMTGKKKRRHGIVEQATYFNCIVLIIAAALAIAVTSPIIVDVAMCLGMIDAVYVIWQRYQLSAMKLLRHVINGIREEANKLSVINKELKIAVDSVNTEAQRLSTIEADVKQTLAEQNKNMEEFMSLLSENKETQKRMKQCLKNEAAQQLLEQIVGSDENKNFQIDPEEIDMLVLRLGTLEGLEIDEERFRKKMLLRGYGVSSALTLVNNLVGQNADEDDDEIFKLDVKAFKRSYTKRLSVNTIQTN